MAPRDWATKGRIAGGRDGEDNKPFNVIKAFKAQSFKPSIKSGLREQALEHFTLGYEEGYRHKKRNPSIKKISNGKWIPAKAVKIVTKAGRKFLHILT